MNMTKSMLAGFAIFASILMLMTTCIAGPVQEKVSIDAVEYAEQQLVSSIDATALKIQNDLYIKSLIGKISSDRTLNALASAIENTDDLDEKRALVDSYVDVLQNKQAFISLKAYFERSYSGDAQNIDAKSDGLLALLKEYLSTNTVTENSGLVPYSSTDGDAIQLPGGGNNDDYSDDSGMLSSGIQTIGAVGSNSFTLLPGGSAQAQWPGFLRNMNGEMYIPGTGWVNAEEYGWLEDYVLSFDLNWSQIADFLSLLGLAIEIIGEGIYYGSMILCVLFGIILGLSIVFDIGGIILKAYMLFLCFGFFFTAYLGTIIENIGTYIKQLGQWIYNNIVNPQG